MKHGAVFTEYAAEVAKKHLLQHYAAGHYQEDLCFGLWRQSTGSRRKTAIVFQILLPTESERNLHGNVSFEPHYLSRVVREARRQDAGVAFLHSHPTSGWQDMSGDDIFAERDVISFPSRVTGKPLVGLTVGRDGYWSARWWEQDERDVTRHWCNKVRVVGGKKYELYLHPKQTNPNGWSDRLRRTEDSWGMHFQTTVETLEVGVVGVGSVGCIVAESLARIGIGSLTLIDSDRLEEHNLDRLFFGTADRLGQQKVDIAAEALQAHATHRNFFCRRVAQGIQNSAAYKAALDCDLIFSCVDSPVGRDVLNYIAQAHLIPVIDAGVAVEAFREPRKFFGAHWRAHIVSPEHQCLRCAGQYNSGEVVAELDGSLTDPTYIKGLEAIGAKQNMNTFPFALGAASLQVNLALRYMLGLSWWPVITRQEYQFAKGTVTKDRLQCHEGCNFRDMVSAGDGRNPPYLRDTVRTSPGTGKVRTIWDRLKKAIASVLGKI